MKNKISQILTLLSNGNIDQGLGQAKDLYKTNPHNIDVIKLLVYAYILVGNFEKVVLVLEQSLRLKKNIEQERVCEQATRQSSSRELLHSI